MNHRLLVVLAVLTGSVVVTAAPAAAAAGTWGPAQSIDSTNATFTGVSCPVASPGFCAATTNVPGGGDLFTYTNGTWSRPTAISSGAAEAVSCVSSTFCLATDSAGDTITWNGTSWGAPQLVDATNGSPNDITGISCLSTRFCMAVDASNNALAYNGSSWTVTPIDAGGLQLNTVSCASTTFCVAGDSDGDVDIFTGSWAAPSPSTLSGGVDSVSCATTTFCMAVGTGGDAASYNGSAWTGYGHIDPTTNISSVSCPTDSFCMAVDDNTRSSQNGDALLFQNGSWAVTPLQTTNFTPVPFVTAVSCASASSCWAGDSAGDVTPYNGPAVPDAPTGLIATAGNASAQLSWSAPASSACAITSYTITPVQNGTPGTPIQTGSAATSYSPTGLTNGATYTFTVAATNCNGTGPAASSARVIPSAPTTPAPYNPLTPYRICDTRAGNSLAGTDAQCTGHTLGVAATLSIQVAGTTPSGSAGGGVPASGATAVVLNVTATNPTAVSYLTVFPTGSATPLASNLNVAPGETVANLVEVALGSSGQVSIYNNRGSTDVVVDVQGYVGAAPSGAGLFNPLPPSRILDTRAGRGALGPAQSLTLQVTGAGGVPTSGVSGVVLNVTATDTTATSYFTVWPAGASRPTASNLNWAANATVPNRVVVPVSSSGAIEIYNNRGYADVIVDVGGWYTTAGGSGSQLTQFSGITPARILDTRAGSGEPYEGQPIGPTGTLTVAVAGVGGVPANATAVVLNVTVTGTTGDSYLTVFPAGTTRPVASDLNWLPGQTVANLTVVKLGSSGELTLYNNRGAVDAIADVVGWYT
ncbi:MAG: fibronectin type III domain-containing protein [Mycobacteriales bacterium]